MKNKTQISELPILKDKAILVIDSDKNNQLLLCAIFSDKPEYKLVCAKTENEALYWIDSHTIFDLVIIEPLRLENNGFALISYLKAREESLPVLALTVCAMKHEKQMCFDCGCDAYMSKPFLLNDLIYKVEELIK